MHDVNFKSRQWDVRMCGRVGQMSMYNLTGDRKYFHLYTNNTAHLGLLERLLKTHRPLAF